MRCLLVLFAVLSIAPTSIPAASADEAAELHQLFDDAWEFDLEEDPLWATHVGDHRANDELPEATIEAHQRRRDAKQEFLDRLAAIERDDLSQPDRISYDIFERLLRDELAEYDFQTHLTPITNRWGFHIDFAELPKNVPLETARDYENYIARLNAFRRYTAEHIELMRRGIRDGLVLPGVVLEGYQDTIEPHVVENPEQSLLFAPFGEFPDRVNGGERERLTDAAKTAIRESIVPAYRDFLTFMQKEYLPATRGSIGAAALPRGRDFYRHRVRKFTTLDLAPEQVHQTGLKEVERIRNEMEEIIR
ncbi:MAG: DUF885 domain-containing protein, partial [Planctomycetes bacterium]|nr:DUF885 domain-containing protein [Planctomycetota bacterium]